MSLGNHLIPRSSRCSFWYHVFGIPYQLFAVDVESRYVGVREFKQLSMIPVSPILNDSVVWNYASDHDIGNIFAVPEISRTLEYMEPSNQYPKIPLYVFPHGLLRFCVPLHFCSFSILRALRKDCPVGVDVENTRTLF
jgi:hypothetical protein